MPRANWNISADVIDDWDRDSQFVPYSGPVPPNRVYKWQITALTYAPGEGKKRAQLSIGLTLVARTKEEKEYEGYRCWKNAWPSPKNQFTYVPFLDALGVSGADFERRCNIDEEGNILGIGRWHNNGRTLILGQREDNVWVDNQGATHNDKSVGWVGAVDSDAASPADDEDEEDWAEDEDDTEDEYEEEEEEAPPPRRNKRPANRTANRPATAAARRVPNPRRKTRPTDDEDF